MFGRTEVTNVTTIDSYVENGVYNGFGYFTYSNNSIMGVRANDVVVHTPVVAQNIQIKPQDFINQKVNKDSERIYLQLDNDFEIIIPDEGTHKDIKGYGTRSYNSNQGINENDSSWGAIKDVKLPFDAYYLSNIDGKKYFLPKGNWLSSIGEIKVDLKSSKATNGYRFTIPVWVEEKYYENDEAIEIRVISENAYNNYGLKVRTDAIEEGANKDINNYVAYAKVPVEVIGEVYDLRIIYSSDPDWYLRVKSGLYSGDVVLANEFPFGNTYHNNNQSSQNKNTSYSYAPKVGYDIVFSLKTKGRKGNNIEITATQFSYVSKNGGNSEEVDLWYKPSYGPYQKIALNEAVGNYTIQPVSVAHRDLNSSSSVHIYTPRIYLKELQGDAGNLYSKYIYTNPPYNYAIKIDLGGFTKISLPQNLRFVYDNLNEYIGQEGKYNKEVAEIVLNAMNDFSDDSENGAERIMGSVANWYGGYRLPSSTIAVKQGENPNNNQNSIKKNGYILVSMDVKSKYNVGDGENNYDYLQYKGPEGRYTITESKEKVGQRKPSSSEPEISFETTKTIKLPNGKSAVIPANSIVMYETDYSSIDDYIVGGNQ